MANSEDVFEAELFECFRTARRDSLLEITPNVPDLVYHYTSAEGCFGILHTSATNIPPSLWASSAFSLNDRTEVQYGLSVVHDVAKNMVDHRIVDSFFGLDEDGNYRHLEFMQDTCVASFCGKPDLLSQWRAYGRGGSGYAIGFRREELAAAGAANRYELVPVIYRRDDQRRVVQEFFNKAAAAPERIGDDAFSMRTVDEAMHLALFFKNDTFEEEQEWRLATPRPSSVLRYRMGAVGVISYRVISFERRGVAELWLGPTLDRNATERLWSDYLRKHYGMDYQGQPAVSIHTSRIPLRTIM